MKQKREKTKIEVVEGVLSSKNKFKRAFIVLIVAAVVTCFCVYNGDKIASVVKAWRGTAVEAKQAE